jgi:hypothetical protein
MHPRPEFCRYYVADHVGHGDFGLHETAAALDLRAIAIRKEGVSVALILP